MVVLDLFPAGIIQFQSVVERGLWFGRSAEFIDQGVFKSLTWLRGIGATVFFVGGVIPLTFFMVTRVRHLKKPKDTDPLSPNGQPGHEMDLDQLTKEPLAVGSIK